MYQLAVETRFNQVNEEPGPDLVTVAISLYNYAQFIEQCLDSIHQQCHASLDLLVVDDASTDDSSKVAHDWMAKNVSRFHRITLLRHSRNQGLAQARNTAFARSRSDLVFVVDADNMIYPRALSRLHQVMSTGAFAAAYTQLELFGSVHRIGDADVWRKDIFRDGNYVDAMALVSREAWRKVGGYTHIEGGWEDFDFWCKFIDHELSAAFVPEILCRYRVHNSSMVRSQTHLVHERLKVELTLRHPWLRFQI